VKKYAAIVAAAATVVALAGCAGGSSGSGGSGSGGSADQSFKMGVVIPSGDHGFTGESVAHAKAEAEQLMADNSGLDITVKDGIDASAQIASIENLLAGGDLDMIMLWPMEGEALRSTAQNIVDAGVKLVVYDRLITDFKGLSGQIMGDNVGIGTMMGDYVTKFYAADDKVNYLRFVGDSSTVTSQRSSGFDDVVDKGKFVQVANTFTTDWSSETAQNQMEDWLNSASTDDIANLDLLVTHDDEITDGVMNALESYTGAGKLNVKLITSVGGRQETLDKFEGTKLDTQLTTYYFSPSFIREALRLSVSQLTGKSYTGAKETDGIYLIPSFSISNAGNADHDFDSYRASDVFTERYSIKS
jgi:ribose transport system substrate-binding protein